MRRTVFLALLAVTGCAAPDPRVAQIDDRLATLEQTVRRLEKRTRPPLISFGPPTPALPEILIPSVWPLDDGD
jgi:hypothetical protein